MFKLFRKLLGRDSTTGPVAKVEVEVEVEVEVDETLSDIQILQEYFSPPKKARQALRQFMLLISQRLGVHESKRLTNRVMACLQPGKTTDEALVHGLVDERGQQHGQWVLIHLDCRATEEVEWQANEVLRTHGVTVSWHLGEIEGMTPPQALGAFSIWVRQYGLSLLHLQTGDTDWCAFLVEESNSLQVLQLAEQAGLKVQREEEFLADHL